MSPAFAFLSVDYCQAKKDKSWGHKQFFKDTVILVYNLDNIIPLKNSQYKAKSR